MRLHYIEKITPLTGDEFAFVRSHFTPKKLRKHQLLVQEGEGVPNDFFVLLAGPEGKWINMQKIGVNGGIL